MDELTISPIQAFSDNYIWLLKCGKNAFVVDPGDAAPVIKTLKKQNLTLKGILITHHHFDHTGGVQVLKQHTGCDTWGPDTSPAGEFDHIVREGDKVQVLGTSFSVIAVPGHTLDHIAYYSELGQALFCGDTLFVGGCGRVFEGTHNQMRVSLSKLRDLPATTQVFCAHEYTLANLKFAHMVEPNNDDLNQFLTICEAKRRRGLPTVPSTIAKELTYNPFLRWDYPEIRHGLEIAGRLVDNSEDGIFTTIREWKNQV